MLKKATRLTDTHPDTAWPKDTPLFIDGLDERLAGRDPGSRGDAIGDILRHLGGMGWPRFRISCREDFWDGSIDERLREASGGKVAVLRLVPLDETQSRALLQRWPDLAPDVDRFWTRAHEHGLQAMLDNPLLLELLAKAVRGDDWPDSRAGIYARACAVMAADPNESHRKVTRGQAGKLDRQLNDAGLLCAVCLLSGADALTLAPFSGAGRDVAVETLPVDLALDQVNGVLSSKLFIADGERRLPRHRTIAEYLAARSLAGLVQHKGLPVARVLALMSAYDGGIVEALRGLHAWLASFLPEKSVQLFPLDPVGIVCNGDVRPFVAEQKRSLFEALRAEARRDPGFHRDIDYRFSVYGALGTADMATDFCRWLGAPDRDEGHLSWLYCVLDAIRHGEPMTGLDAPLLNVLKDRGMWPGVRRSALQAWCRQAFSEAQLARSLWDEMARWDGDPQRDELRRTLLAETYPGSMSLGDLLSFWRGLDPDVEMPSQYGFERDLIEKTPDEAMLSLIDAVVADRGLLRRPGDSSEAHPLAAALLCRALPLAGETAPAQQLNAWLSLGLDAYGSFAGSDTDRQRITQWLDAHPGVRKAVLAHAFAQAADNTEIGESFFRRCKQRVHLDGHGYPSDWYPWLLDQASQAAHEPLVRHCLSSAASAVVESAAGGLTMEAVCQWVEDHGQRWPKARQWLLEEWSCKLDDPLGAKYRRQRDERPGRAKEREERRAQFDRFRADFARGVVPPEAMDPIAFAHLKMDPDIQGDTPLLRVQDLLQGTSEEALATINGLPAALRLRKLPSWREVLELQVQGKMYNVRPVCLLAAQLDAEADPQACATWSDELARTLVAFHVTAHSGGLTPWYQQIAKERPALVAQVLARYAESYWQPIRRTWTNGLLRLAKEPDQAGLARHLLPPLLRSAPCAADESSMLLLQFDLLPAAVKHLPANELQPIVTDRVADERLEARPRIAWLVAGLACDAGTFGPLLRSFAGDSVQHLLCLAETSHHIHGRADDEHSVALMMRVVEVLGREVSPRDPGFWRRSGADGMDDHLRNMVHYGVSRLLYSSSPQAGEALAELVKQPALHGWSKELKQAQVQHARRMREAMFKPKEPQAVAQVLANRRPATSEDLAALLIEHLSELAQDWRGRSGSGVAQFWPAGGNHEPLDENPCRDALLRELRPRLASLEVHIDDEAAAADGKRADLRLMAWGPGKQFSVPVEIKKDSHPKVWTAWRDQLSHYALDPAADRVCVYVVLWFGHKTRALRRGARPGTAEEMAQMLTQQVGRPDWPRLSGLVIDLSRLPAKARKQKRR